VPYYIVYKINSTFHPPGVSTSSTGLYSWGYAGAR